MGICRRAATLILVMAIGAVPLVAEWCATSCEHTRDASTTTEPTCHHADSPAVRIGQTPTPCGHDHTDVVVLAAKDAPVTSRELVSVPIVAIARHTPPVQLIATIARAGDAFGRPISPIPLALSSSLRI